MRPAGEQPEIINVAVVVTNDVVVAEVEAVTVVKVVGATPSAWAKMLRRLTAPRRLSGAMAYGTYGLKAGL